MLYIFGNYITKKYVKGNIIGIPHAEIGKIPWMYGK